MEEKDMARVQGHVRESAIDVSAAFLDDTVWECTVANVDERF